jgi:hypothetical protein
MINRQETKQDIKRSLEINSELKYTVYSSWINI